MTISMWLVNTHMCFSLAATATRHLETKTPQDGRPTLQLQKQSAPHRVSLSVCRRSARVPNNTYYLFTSWTSWTNEVNLKSSTLKSHRKRENTGRRITSPARQHGQHVDCGRRTPLPLRFFERTTASQRSFAWVRRHGRSGRGSRVACRVAARASGLRPGQARGPARGPSYSSRTRPPGPARPVRCR